MLLQDTLPYILSSNKLIKAKTESILELVVSMLIRIVHLENSIVNATLPKTAIATCSTAK